MNTEISVFHPKEMSAADLDSCLAIIKEGKAVNIASAATEVPKAELVAVHRVDGKIVAVGVIKRKRPWYADDISKKSGFSVARDLHELGYVAVTESHRGNKISKKITRALLAAFPIRPLFATTSAPKMKTTLAAEDFEQCGGAWAGETGELSLWILFETGSGF